MPTMLPRSQITHVPRVQRIVDAGQELWPEKSPGAVLVDLAEERLNQITAKPDTPTRQGFTLLPRTRPGVLTSQMVEDIVNQD